MVALLDTAGRVDLELEQFEAIPAGDRFLLLRVAGSWSLAEGVRAPEPRLLVQRGSQRQLLTPLPGGDEDWRHDDGRLWWAGYALPADIAAEARTRFWLHAGDDARYPLPAPVERALLDGERAEIVVRGGRPYLHVAAGLMAAAVIPLGAPAGAHAQDEVATTPAETTPAVTTVAPTTTETAPADLGNVPVVETPKPKGSAGATAAPRPKPGPKPKPNRTRAPKRPTPAAPKQEAPPAPKPERKHKAKGKTRTAENPSTTPTTDPQDQGTLDPTPHVTSVPSPLLENFHIPPFLLPIYQAAGMEYGIPWQLLAAINEVETDYGRNLNVSSAGALGWMQFMPATWKMYGVDANLDGERDPFNPADAIFAAARYLDAAGAGDDPRRGVFAYNHADWYVDMVMAKAERINAMPADVVDSLTGLTQGRFPVPGSVGKGKHKAKKVSYTHPGEPWPGASGDVDPSLKAVNIRSAVGHKVIAVADGKVVAMGRNRMGGWLVLEDAYGNRFTYGHLGSTAKQYAAPKRKVVNEEKVRRELHLPHGRAHGKGELQGRKRAQGGKRKVNFHPDAPAVRNTWPRSKERLFANPRRPDAYVSGGKRQLQADAPPSVLAAAAKALGLKPSQIVLKELRPGARLVAGTVIGRLGGRTTIEGRAAVQFKVRPAGKKAPFVDPKPLLDGWRLLEDTEVYGPAGSSTLNPAKGIGVGRLMLMSKADLGRRILADDRITIYEGGRDDIRSGQIDRRVLALLAYLAESGLHPTVTCLKNGHSFYTAGGNVSLHSSGHAVDIGAINGTVIQPGTQGPGSITEKTIKAILRLQGAMVPDEIISLMDWPGHPNAFAQADHYDHIHVGFPLAPGEAERATLGKQVAAVLKPGQWSTLMGRLSTLRNPRVLAKPSKYSLKVEDEG